MTSAWRFIDWLGRHEFGVLLAILCVMGSVWGFGLLADEVGEGDTKQFDEAVLLAMRRDQPADHSVPVGPPWMSDAARDVTALGSITVLLLAVAAVAGFLALRREYGAVTLVVGASLGGLILSTLLKQVFVRPRPDLVPHLAGVYTQSFPSGHSMLSAVVYLTLGTLMARLVPRRRLKVYFLAVALVLALLVGVSRVYLGVHYPTDVLAGWTAGLAWALLCWLAARWLQRRGKVTRDVTHRSPPSGAAA